MSPFLRFPPGPLIRIALVLSTGPFLLHAPADALALMHPESRKEGVCGELGRGNFAAVDRAVGEGRDIDAPDPKDLAKRPPLVCAAEEGWIDAVRFLLERKADVNSRDASGRTALMAAASENDKRKSGAFAAIVKALLASGADRNAKDDRGDTALALAIGNRNAVAVELLAAGGADVNLGDGEGRSPLMLAAEEGNADMVEALLAAKARVEDRDRRGKTAWAFAAEKAHRPVMDRLRKAGAVERYEAVDPAETFRNAAIAGDTALMKRMTRRGITLRAKRDLFREAIALSAYHGRLDAVRFLLDGGAPAGGGREGGDPPLLAAMEDYSGTGRESAVRTEIARLLIARGAGVNDRGGQGETALVRAIRWDNPGAVVLLLSKGARTDFPDSGGMPPLSLAARKGSVEMVRALLESRADAEARDREGKTPFSWAVIGGRKAVADLLLAAGASPDYASVEWEGKESAVAEPLDVAVTDGEEWSRLWRRAFGEDAPVVDFGRYFVACVFLGHRADWWYSIDLKDPVVKGGEYEVGYGLVMLRVRAAPEAFRSTGFRGQYAMKVFPKREGTMPVVRLVFKEGDPVPARGGEPMVPSPVGEFPR